MKILSSTMLRQMTPKNKLILNKSLTRRAHVFLGTKCSYHCKFCYGNGRRNRSFFPKERVEEYIKFLYNYGIEILEYTGGEPTEYDDLLNLVRNVSSKYHMKQSIITNGSGSHELYEKLYQYGVSEFLFSLHGYDKSSHEKITGVVNSWDKLINSIKDVQNFEHPLIRINVTICKYNYKNLFEQMKFILEEFPRVFMINYLPMNSWDAAVLYDDISVPYKLYVDELLKIFRHIKNHRDDIRLAIRYVPYCVLNKELYPYVYNHLQHAYDEYDWNQELDGMTIHEEYLNHPYGYYTASSILNKRESLYVKFKTCLSCDKFYVCDGFQKNQILREGL